MTMRHMVFAMLLAGSLALAGLCSGAWAVEPAKTAEAAKAAGAPKTAGAGKKSPVTDKNEAQVNAQAEARYQEYLEREKAADERDINSLRGKIEDKYKGYVRPKRPKKGQKK